MGIVIDHVARKHEIIAKSIQLFAEQGYDGVTYQKIATRCGIARTTLYKYFHNKRVIFNTAIWEVTDILVGRYADILSSHTSAAERLEELMNAVLKMLYTQKLMLTVILDYLLAAQRAGHSVARAIAAHTIGLRRIVQHLLLEGVRSGELKPVNVRLTMDLLYAQLEATVLRLTVSQNPDLPNSQALFLMTIESLKKESK